MFAVRSISRLAPRTTSRFIVPTSSRSISSARLQPSTFHASWRKSVSAVRMPRLAAAFSRSAAARQDAALETELVAKLESELQLEKEMKEYNELPVSVKDYIENGPFKLVDKAGEENVELVREYNGETIRVGFTIADINALDQDVVDDEAYADEPVEDAEKLQKEAESDGEGEEYNDQPGFPARVNITIEKANKGALQIEAIAQDGMIVVDNIYYHDSAKVATEQTAEADWSRRGVYSGPPFGNLDEDLQVLLEKYLDERGINSQLALFIPDYIDYKEQTEYMRWLNNVKDFVKSS